MKSPVGLAAGDCRMQRNWMLDKAIDLVSDLKGGFLRLVAVSACHSGVSFTSTVGRHG